MDPGIRSVLVAAMLSPAVATAGPQPRPNILVLVTDQLSATMMGCAGTPWVGTPNLDALARQGVRFERAYAANPVCVPSRFSLMTGRMPSVIGMEDNHHQKNPVPPRMLESSLGNLFARAGYDTVYTGKKHLTGRDPGDGFENPAAYGFTQHLAPEDYAGRKGAVDAGCRFLRERGASDRPFLLYVSMINPHDICHLPLNDHARATGVKPLYRDAEANRLIDSLLAVPGGMSRAEFVATRCPPLPGNFGIPAGELPSFTTVKADNYIGWSRRTYAEEDWRLYRYLYARLTEVADGQIGQILDALRDSGVEGDTLVVFTSDHGDQNAAHRAGLKGYLYEESASIPFILKWPGRIATGQVDRVHLVSNGLDLLPTLCEFAGIAAPEGLPGRSVKPLAAGPAGAEWRDTLVVENNGARLVLFDGTWKYMVDAGTNGCPGEMLINLADDPGEMINLASSPPHRDKLERGRRSLPAWYAAHGMRPGDGYAPASASPRTVARAEAPPGAEDILCPLDPGRVAIGGYVGERIDTCISHGILAADWRLYVAPFAARNDDPSKWQGEFWGKWFTSAALAYRYRPTPAHRAVLDGAVDALLKTQTPDGRLSSYTKDFGDWDVWGRKYALLGLVAHHDATGDRRSLDAAVRALDSLISVAGPGRRKLTETGLPLLEALSSSSILEPVALLYRRTGEPRLLDFARHLVGLWSEPNAYTADGMRLVEDALAGAAPIDISSPKGYEQMSCFEGLCELYRATGEARWRDAAVAYARRVRDTEITIVGSGSSGELWCDGRTRQTELLEQPMETCVTATWMKLCLQMLRLTGDPSWADAMETTLYNALLGAMLPDGRWWAYFSPLAGERVPSPLQVPSVRSSCCAVNGPRALMTVPAWSVMRDDRGLVVNLYAPGEWRHAVAPDREVTLRQATAYPADGEIRLTVAQAKPATYSIRLRIPAWSRRTRLAVNGVAIDAPAASYVEIRREWKDGDTIALSLDVCGRVIRAPGSANQMAVMRGPLVLALDDRLAPADDRNVWLLHDGYEWKHDKAWKLDYALLRPAGPLPEEMILDLRPVEPPPPGVRMAFEVPFLVRPTHFVKHEKIVLRMCDYASAGNRYAEENLFRVWLPQPLFMRQAYPAGTWRIVVGKDKPRPEPPAGP